MGLMKFFHFQDFDSIGNVVNEPDHGTNGNIRNNHTISTKYQKQAVSSK